MTFKESAEFRMPFGKYSGVALDKIAETDEGLKYLDWLYGECKNPEVSTALGRYLGDASIRKELEKLL